MNLRYRGHLYRDEEGDELEGAANLHAHALSTASDLIRSTRSMVIRNWFDCSFEVTDESGQVVLVMPFGDTVAGVNDYA
jgi:hypothetical protein